jgi:hypothetical protein
MSQPRHWPIDLICSMVMMLFLLGLAGYALIQHFLH